MSENKIKVTATTSTKPVRVSVSTPATQGNVTFSQDTSAYNANLAQQWAVSENLVSGQDYSSKYYANKAKESATNATNTYASIQDTYQDFQDESNIVLNELNLSKAEGLEQIDVAKNNAINDINNTKTTIITDIEFVANGEKQEIEELIDASKDEIQELTNEIKDNANDIINRVGYSMFDTVVKDHILTYEESRGLALQGTWVYKEAIAGERWGYSNFYAKVVEEYNEATATETVNGVTVKVHSNGHKFYDIANKSAIDSSFNSLGSAWYYGVDTANERVFLPRNNYFEQVTGTTSEVGDSVEAGLPNIKGSVTEIRKGSLGAEAIGSLYETKTANYSYSGYSSSGASNVITLSVDASRSNSIYGNSNTVQPNAVKKLLYICVGNQVADTSWINVVEQVKNGAKDIDNVRISSLNQIDTNREDSIEAIEDVTKQCIADVELRGAELRSKMALSMFDTILKDHVLSYEETQGLALQGTWVYKTAIAGSRYGYPDFYNKCLEEFEQSTPRTANYNSTLSWTVYQAPNGHMYIDVLEKEKIDTCFNEIGMAWYYIIDRENERIFLPRNIWFEQMSMDTVGNWVLAGLPNITGQLGAIGGGPSKATGAFYDAGTSSAIANTGENDGLAGFDASRCSSVYGNSDTVQPNAVKKLLYICVGNTVSDTSWVDVVTQVEGGVKDIQVAEQEAIERLKATSNALNTTQITNCLLEVPQNIKLELADGVLTLKAGSKVIVPNGAGVFDEVVVHNDINFNPSSLSNRTGLLYVKNSLDTPSLGLATATSSTSGATTPSVGWHYNTTDNIVYRDGNAENISLPIAIVTNVNGTGATSIDQVFNGMGYIGSTAWVDKGVKGLIPNGRNEDGTLRSIEVVTDKFDILNLPDFMSGRQHAPLVLNSTGSIRASLDIAASRYYEVKNKSDIVLTRDYSLWYVSSENKCYYLDGTFQIYERQLAYIGYMNVNDTLQIASLDNKQPFRAMDSNEVPHIIETYVNGTSWYRVYSDGWCEQGGNVGGNSVTFLKSFTSLPTVSIGITTMSGTNTFNYNTAKGIFGNSLTVNGFSCGQFGQYWRACGYIA